MATSYNDQINGLGGSPSSSGSITSGGQGIAYKAPCRVATTGNITLSGTQTIDGVAVVAGDRVLVRAQTNQVDNGIWLVSSGTWTRAPDFDSNRDITKGTRVTLTDGSTLAAKEYMISSANPISIGTDNITFTETLSSDAGSSAAAAAASASAASTSASNAASSASSASTSATNASSSASSASTSATNASNSASTASTAATNAGNSASAAATSATAAQTAETNAETAEAAAEAAQAAAEAAATSINPALFVEIADTDASGFGFVIDEDNMASNSATKVPTQQSVKAYVDGGAWGAWAVTPEMFGGGISGLEAALADGRPVAVTQDITYSAASRVTVPSGARLIVDAIITNTSTSDDAGIFYLAPGTTDVQIVGTGGLYGPYTASTPVPASTYPDCNGAIVVDGDYDDLCELVVVEGLEIFGWGTFGIFAENATNSRFEKNHIHKVGRDGIRFYGADRCKANFNTIHNITPGLAGTPPNLNVYGITYSRRSDAASTPLTENPPSRTSQAIGNNIYDCPTWKCLDTHGGVDLIFAFNTIRDAFIGIGVDEGDTSSLDDAPPKRVSIVYNNVALGSGNTGGAGIHLNSSGTSNMGEGNVVAGNAIDDCGSTNFGAISFSYQQNLRVEENYITNADYYAIRSIVGRSHSTRIASNIIKDMTNTVAAISVEDANSSAIIESGTFHRGSGTFIAFNFVSPNATFGVQLGDNLLFFGTITKFTSGSDTALVPQYVRDEVEEFIPAENFVPPVTNGAQAGVRILGSNGQALSYYAFDTGTQEILWCKWLPRKRYDGGTITFAPVWTAESGSGTVEFELSAVAVSNDDALDAAPGTAQASADTLLTAGDVHVGPTSSAITIAGTFADGDFVWLKLVRDVANDTLGVDAQFLGLKLFYATDQADDSA